MQWFRTACPNPPAQSTSVCIQTPIKPCILVQPSTLCAACDSRCAPRLLCAALAGLAQSLPVNWYSTPVSSFPSMHTSCSFPLCRLSSTTRSRSLSRSGTSWSSSSRCCASWQRRSRRPWPQKAAQGLDVLGLACGPCGVARVSLAGRGACIGGVRSLCQSYLLCLGDCAHFESCAGRLVPAHSRCIVSDRCTALYIDMPLQAAPERPAEYLPGVGSCILSLRQH